MISLDDWVTIRRQLENLDRLDGQDQGELKHIMERLKKEFGLDSVEAGERAVKAMTAREIKKFKAISREYARFKKEHARALRRAARAEKDH